MGRSRRTVYLLDELFQDLKYYKEIQDSIAAEYPGCNQEGCVFCQESGQPYEPRTYQDLFKRCVRQAVIRDANFHALRHPYAARCFEAGVDIKAISEQLGYANVKMTYNICVHLLEDTKEKEIDKLGCQC